MSIDPSPLQKISKPAFAVPKLSCDCHAHILGPTDRFPLAATRSYDPALTPPPVYLRMLGQLGIERMVVVQASCYGADNRRVVAALDEIGRHRARGVAIVTDTTPEAELKALTDSGVRAARFITTAQGGPTLDKLPAVARRVAPFGWHAEVYVKNWGALLPLVQDLPIPVVFDHLAGVSADAPADNEVLTAALRLIDRGKAWVKLSGSRNTLTGPPYTDVAKLAQRFVKHAPERCVWGSDWPHVHLEGRPMPDDGVLLNLLQDWAPDEAMRKRILVDNPAKLYEFG